MFGGGNSWQIHLWACLASEGCSREGEGAAPREWEGATGWLCQGERKGHPWVPESGPGFGAASSRKPYTCSCAVLSSCLTRALLVELENGLCSCRSSDRGIFSCQNCWLLLVLLVMFYLISHSHPFFKKERSATHEDCWQPIEIQQSV